MPQRNEWQQRFGAARRATDRALLALAERAIALEEAQAAKKPQGPSAAFLEACERQRIAAAFGRPLDGDKQ